MLVSVVCVVVSTIQSIKVCCKDIKSVSESTKFCSCWRCSAGQTAKGM
jgi:hypothetical protein